MPGCRSLSSGRKQGRDLILPYHDLTAGDRREVPGALLVVAVQHDRRPDPVRVHVLRAPGLAARPQLLAEDRQLPRRGAHAAVLVGPVRDEPVPGGEQAREVLPETVDRHVGGRGSYRRRVGLLRQVWACDEAPGQVAIKLVRRLDRGTDEIASGRAPARGDDDVEAVSGGCGGRRRHQSGIGDLRRDACPPLLDHQQRAPVAPVGAKSRPGGAASPSWSRRLDEGISRLAAPPPARSNPSDRAAGRSRGCRGN